MHTIKGVLGAVAVRYQLRSDSVFLGQDVIGEVVGSTEVPADTHLRDTLTARTGWEASVGTR